jgi:hypothetical protein
MRDEAKVAGCRLQVAGCRLQVAGCRLQVAGCRLQVAGCRLQVAGCALNVGEVERPGPLKSPPWIWRQPSNVAGGRIHACSEDVPTSRVLA